MTLDVTRISPQVLPHFKGGDGEAHARLLTDELGKIMHCTLPPGASIGPHVHEGSYEVMYFLSGTGVCIDDGQEVPLRPGTVRYCRPGHSHSIVNTGREPLVLFAVIPTTDQA